MSPRLLQIISPLIAPLLWMLALMVVISLCRLPVVKGWWGEYLVRGWIKRRLDPAVYHGLHNLTLPTSDGSTQIDHVLVSRYGIFVLETKNMSGWIFGGEKQASWTQTIYRRSIKFQNPLRQNFRHLKALQEMLDIAPTHLHSVIVFVGSARLKTQMPPNVTQGIACIEFIRSFQQPLWDDLQVNAMIEQIQRHRLAPGWSTNRQHVAALKARHAIDVPGPGRSQTPPAAALAGLPAVGELVCQRCARPMVLRQTRQGANAGANFWGCSGFPGCRFKVLVDAA